ncbi:hypothetical protein UFOVP781_17 [uncultured Caudovirales phage]|uniref:Uncharacterized protein n=1 Tax=uncultured Caudovirales phage TaxID=2100421 RepID=A0A6J5LMI2_9CAUD|nr:hypothetical protein UFOVP279_46 [uncultured Caudovirales phage]CAB4162096.1 hypothetical protein UFOVP781_17 [uncultured Caudovirales phage]
MRTQCRTPRTVRRDSRRDGNRPAKARRESVPQTGGSLNLRHLPYWLHAGGTDRDTRSMQWCDSRRDGTRPMIDADDYSAACDDLADIGLTEDQIDDVWRWHRITARRQAQTAGGVAIVRLLTYMLTGHKDSNLHLRLVGLAFGVGMGHITGHEHQAAAAHALGVSRQAVADAGERARKAILG